VESHLPHLKETCRLRRSLSVVGVFTNTTGASPTACLQHVKLLLLQYTLCDISFYAYLAGLLNCLEGNYGL
jgi:hypothetical protein